MNPDFYMYIVVFLQFLPVHIGIRNYGIFQFRILSALKETVFWGFSNFVFWLFCFLFGGGGVFKGVGVLVGEGGRNYSRRNAGYPLRGPR